MVPIMGLPPLTSSTSQTTEDVVGVEFCTLAVKITMLLTATVLTGAETLTIGGGGKVIVSIAEPETFVLDWSTALIITAAGLGTAAGAV